MRKKDNIQNNNNRLEAESSKAVFLYPSSDIRYTSVSLIDKAVKDKCLWEPLLLSGIVKAKYKSSAVWFERNRKGEMDVRSIARKLGLGFSRTSHAITHALNNGMARIEGDTLVFSSVRQNAEHEYGIKKGEYTFDNIKDEYRIALLLNHMEKINAYDQTYQRMSKAPISGKLSEEDMSKEMKKALFKSKALGLYGDCFNTCGLKKLAKVAHCSVPTVIRLIGIMIERGYIDKKYNFVVPEKEAWASKYPMGSLVHVNGLRGFVRLDGERTAKSATKLPYIKIQMANTYLCNDGAPIRLNKGTNYRRLVREKGKSRENKEKTGDIVLEVLFQRHKVIVREGQLESYQANPEYFCRKQLYGPGRAYRWLLAEKKWELQVWRNRSLYYLD